jgi:hypothetical protein
MMDWKRLKVRRAFVTAPRVMLALLIFALIALALLLAWAFPDAGTVDFFNSVLAD